MAELADELGEAPPAHPVGTLHVASSEESIGAIGRLVPWLDLSSVRGCILSPDDSFIDPYLLADAYATVARRRGAHFRLGVEVFAVSVYGGRVQGLLTADGAVWAPVIVLAAGAWANRLAAPLGCGLAMAPVRSQYWLTETDQIFPRQHPVVILPDARAYTRPELGGLLFGLREGASVGLDPGELPDDMSGYAFADDPDGWRSLEEGAPALRAFFPALDRVRIRRYVVGASTYTPDGLPLIGQVGGIEGLLVASGCCGAGIAVSGGLGHVLTSLVLDDAPSFELAPFRPERFGNVEPSEPAFRARCAAARARKRGG